MIDEGSVLSTGLHKSLLVDTADTLLDGANGSYSMNLFGICKFAHFIFVDTTFCPHQFSVTYYVLFNK